MSCRLSIAIPIVLGVIAIIVIIAVPLALKFKSQKAEPVIPVNVISNMSNTEFIHSLGNFSANLYSELAQLNASKNIFFSPFSIHTCLAMARMGADGDTALEMDRILNFADKSVDSVADNFYTLLNKYKDNSLLSVANKVYVMQNYEVRDEFNQALSQKFLSSVEPIDFGESSNAASSMNNWVEGKTQGAIKNLISPTILSSDTRLFLLSAIYFKGEWATTFPVNDTSEQDFYTNEVDTVKVQMMFKKNLFHYNIFPELDATAVRLLYKESDLSMLIFLPNSRTGLPTLADKLRNTDLETISKNMRARTNVEVYLPKFKAEYEIELKDVLMKMGMNSMFSSADFSKMLKSPEPLVVSNVVHKAFIDVNEKGTEAAAATGIAVQTRDGGGLQSIVFKADHPFFYIITNADNVRLFEGTFVGV